MIVDRGNYPNLYAAILEIELDNGAHHVNRICGPNTIELSQFTVPDAWAHLAQGAEHGLAKLAGDSADDLDTFLCGDQDIADEIRKRRGNLDEAHILLNGWFNGWPQEDAPFSTPSKDGDRHG